MNDDIKRRKRTIDSILFVLVVMGYLIVGFLIGILYSYVLWMFVKLNNKLNKVKTLCRKIFDIINILIFTLYYESINIHSLRLILLNIIILIVKFLFDII